MSKIDSRTAMILGAIGVILVVIIGWFVLVSPQRSKADKLNVQIADAQQQLAAAEALLGSSVAKKSFADYQDAVRALPDTPKMSQIIRQLAAVLGQSRVELDGMTPGPLAPISGAETVPITITLKGHYFALQKFAKLLRKSADVSDGKIVGAGRLYTIDSIAFNGGAGPDGVIGATVTMNAFIYSTAPPPTPAATPTDTTTTAAGATP